MLVLILGTMMARPTCARAEQRRDFMLERLPDGQFVQLDLIAPAGVRTSLEYRRSIYGSINQLRLRASSLTAWPLGALRLDAELQILILTVGIGGGLEYTWRNLRFAPLEPLSRTARQDGAGQFEDRLWPFVDFRADLWLPLNPHWAFVSRNTLRIDSRPDRSFDWVRATVTDGGVQFRSDAYLFFRHRRYGGFAPTLQALNYPLDRERNWLVSFGLTGVTRLGLRRRNDLLFAQALIHLPDDERYGIHYYGLPLTLWLGYRTIWSL